MFERPGAGERALLLHVGLQRPCEQDETEEFKALAESAGAEIVGEIRTRVARPSPRLLIGGGKAEEKQEEFVQNQEFVSKTLNFVRKH